jgi:multiple sugar transport system permease protein
MAARKLVHKIIISIIAYILFLLLIFPYLVMLLTSLKPKTEVYVIPPHFFPKQWIPDNFINIWKIIPLSDYLLNSLLIAGGSTILALVLAMPAAYALARMKFTGQNLYIYFIIVTQMFSPIVLLVGLYREIHWFGLMDTIFGLVLVNTAFNQAFAVWLLYGYFTTIPYELEQAAWIDGCTRWQALRRIVLPIAAPGIITAGIYVFVAAWNEFVVALTLIATESNKPLTVGIYAFFGKNDVEWQYLFATSLVATVPVVILFMLVEKYLVGGLTAGSVKH